MSDLDGIDQWNRAKILETRAKGEAAEKETALELAKAKRVEVERETQLMLAEVRTSSRSPARRGSPERSRPGSSPPGRSFSRPS